MAHFSQPVIDEVISVCIFSNNGLIIRALERDVNASECYKVVMHSTDVEKAEEAIKFFKPKIAIVDFNFNHTHGTAFVEKIKQYNHDLLVIAVSNHVTDFRIMRMLDAGARAYLSFNMSEMELSDAIRLLLRGNYFYNQHLTTALMEEYRTWNNIADAPFRIVFEDRLLDILHEVDAGKNYIQIANGDRAVNKKIGKYVSNFTARYNCDVHGLIRRAKDCGLM